jgi:hypothetical protein
MLLRSKFRKESAEFLHHLKHNEFDEATDTSETRKRKRHSDELEADHMVSTLNRKRNQSGYTELHTASENGDYIKVAEILSTNDSSLWSKTNCHNKYTPLHVAIYPQYVALNPQHVEVVRLLLAAGADIDSIAIHRAQPCGILKSAPILAIIKKMLQEEKSRRAYSNFVKWKTDVMFNAIVSKDDEF